MTSADEIVARHGYDGLFRRIEKEIDNQGTGFVFHSDDASVTGIQAGERHEHYYWGGMGVSPVNWRLVETTNHVEVSEAYSYDDSNVLNQFVWGINATLATDHHCIRKKAKLARRTRPRRLGQPSPNWVYRRHLDLRLPPVLVL